MAGLFGRPDYLKCCCGGECVGCCFPVDENGDAIDVPFEVSAPGCAIDGFTGVFNPLALSNRSGPCGICGTWGYSANLSIPGQFWNFNGIGCDLIPICNIEFCITLTCQNTNGVLDDLDDPSCCRRMRMYVAARYRFAGSVDNGGSGVCVGLNFEKWIRPDSCVCEGGLSAIFSLGILNPLTESNPECGEVQPCVPDCDISALRILI